MDPYLITLKHMAVERGLTLNQAFAGAGVPSSTLYRAQARDGDLRFTVARKVKHYLENLPMPTDEQLAATKPGQAAWADFSIGHICKTCRFWDSKNAVEIKGDPLNKQAKCLMARRLVAPKKRSSLPEVPGSATACRFWEAVQ